MILAGSVVLLGAGCVREPAAPPPPPPGGIYRSDDGGVTFAQKVARMRDPSGRRRKQEDRHLARLTPRDVVVPRAEPDTLYVVAEEGVFRSTTAGDSWERLAIPARDVRSISVHPRNPRILLAAGTAIQGSRGKILKSLTAGATWSDIFTTPAGERESGTLFRRRLEVVTLTMVVAHDPGSPQVVFAGTNTGTFLVSFDGGVHWQTRNSFQQGITGLELSPTVPGRLFIRLADGRLIRSNDGGETVATSPVGRRLAEPSGLATALEPEAVHAVLFEPPTPEGIETTLVGTEEGLYRSLDGGETWKQLPFPPTGNVGIPLTSLARSSDGVLWATSGSVLFSSTDGGDTWRASDTLVQQPIRFVVADPINPKRLYLFFSAS